jgi:spore maturation protein CgeB
MKIVIFGLSVSSSWGNGHATIWRGLIRELVNRDHTIVFFEKDVPYYAFNRDLNELSGMELELYSEWDEIKTKAAQVLTKADAAIVTSYCPDALAASDLIQSSKIHLSVFYDLDSPVTLSNVEKGEMPFYIGSSKLSQYDLVLSFTGGIALEKLKTVLGAKVVVPLYGCADPFTHKPSQAQPHFSGDLSYLGTFAQDRQDALERLFIEPARNYPKGRFVIGGAQYPPDFPWLSNIYFVQHVVPSEHSAFYCSSSFTLNITRKAMATMGYCPSGRLFEAAVCEVPVISDYWEGLDYFFTPGEEILIAQNWRDVLECLNMSSERRAKIASAARKRAFANHTAAVRAAELEKILQGF